jgi:serine phosphatase RsbU (regulator of sigma subunit)
MMSTEQSEPKFFGTIRTDLQRGDFGRTVKRDFAELKDYMLEEERKKRLEDMGWLKRWIVLTWWLLKSLFFKLTPARRILLVAGVFLVMLSRTVTYSDQHLRIESDTNVIGVLAILFVLMLELKDKLVAHDELSAGRVVQQTLMPERKPQVPGWDLWLFTRSANEVGGDLVDFLKIAEDRFGVAIGDVAGKGLSAALLMAKLQATLRALAADFTSLAALGTKLNYIFCRDSLRSIFASLVYAELARNSGLVRFVNAGHIIPVVMRPTKIEKVGKGGVALGIMPGAMFEEQRIELNRGDSLLVYSDGVTEAQNGRGEFFGEQRLLDLLPKLMNLTNEEMGERLVTEVDRFVGDAKVHDDLSIVMVRRAQ